MILKFYKVFNLGDGKLKILLIGAELVPTKSNENIFINGDVNKLVGENCIKLLKNADYRIFNLKVPLTDRETQIDVD